MDVENLFISQQSLKKERIFYLSKSTILKMRNLFCAKVKKFQQKGLMNERYERKCMEQDERDFCGLTPMLMQVGNPG